MDGTMRDVERNLGILGRECGSRAVELKIRGLGRWEDVVKAKGTSYDPHLRIHAEDRVISAIGG